MSAISCVICKVGQAKKVYKKKKLNQIDPMQASQPHTHVISPHPLQNQPFIPQQNNSLNMIQNTSQNSLPNRYVVLVPPPVLAPQGMFGKPITSSSTPTKAPVKEINIYDTLDDKKMYEQPINLNVVASKEAVQQGSHHHSRDISRCASPLPSLPKEAEEIVVDTKNSDKMKSTKLDSLTQINQQLSKPDTRSKRSSRGKSASQSARKDIL